MKNPSAELTRQVRGYRDADERVGLKQTTDRVVPANQRLDSDDSSGREVNFRLPS